MHRTTERAWPSVAIPRRCQGPWATLILTTTIVLLLGACAAPSNPTDVPQPELVTRRTAAIPTEARGVVEGADVARHGRRSPPGFEGHLWAEVAGAAVDTTVRWAMWTGDPQINAWIDDYATDMAEGRLALELEVLPLADTVDVVNKIASERAAGVDEGTVDLVWINGENFHTMREADLLYGPWARWVPASRAMDPEDPTLWRDLGVPVEGYELPWGRAQLVFVYDTERVSVPPSTTRDLLDWAAEHPGRFTYPAPPDFTGSAFVRQVCRVLADDPAVFDRPVSDVAEIDIERATAPCWAALSAIAPSLWRGGQTYPTTLGQQNELFANGVVDFDFNYNPAAASRFIERGRYPPTTRTFVVDEGTLANTHYLAIPFNAPNRAGAMTLANFLATPAAQVSKAQPDNWGDLTVLDMSRLSESWQSAFAAIPNGPATLPSDVLRAARLPEPHASWVPVLERGWEEHVLER